MYDPIFQSICLGHRLGSCRLMRIIRLSTRIQADPFMVKKPSRSGTCSNRLNALHQSLCPTLPADGQLFLGLSSVDLYRILPPEIYTNIKTFRKRSAESWSTSKVLQSCGRPLGLVAPSTGVGHDQEQRPKTQAALVKVLWEKHIQFEWICKMGYKSVICTRNTRDCQFS